MLVSQYYMNCIRTEAGYCSIQWKQSSTTSPDPFGIHSTNAPPPALAASGNSATTLCTHGFISIPDLSMDGIRAIPVPLGAGAFQSYMCGAIFGVEGQTTSAALICKPRMEILGDILFLYFSSQTTFCSWSLHQHHSWARDWIQSGLHSGKHWNISEPNIQPTLTAPLLNLKKYEDWVECDLVQPLNTKTGPGANIINFICDNINLKDLLINIIKLFWRAIVCFFLILPFCYSVTMSWLADFLCHPSVYEDLFIPFWFLILKLKDIVSE